eukprot:CAMPEP_0178406312 /NCGR_PEP_ID=MMETSP0689_2-20121128/18847_1 /TAXON_ID=160604 /ORGANISM="Amphidinium massartii, Strain CS-259" /LENGTH=936 /DNA_ID=CAMNT_0020027349 /DNA_START=1 /DNA_END=2808 /DNA_ORIENTATION=+
MPEFGKKLAKDTIEQWQPYYVKYERLKEWIDEADRNGPERAAKPFLEELESNLQTVDAFYCAQEARLHGWISEFARRISPDVPPEEIESDKARLLKEIKLLESFAYMNKEGLRKIAKKFDKKVADALPQNKQGVQATTLARISGSTFVDYETRLPGLRQNLESLATGEVKEVQELPARKRSDSDQPLSQAILPTLNLMDEPPQTRVDTFKGTAVAAFGAVWKHLLLASALAVVVQGLYYYDVSEKLTGHSYFTIWVTSNVLYLLIQRYPPEAVLMAATLILNLAGCLTSQEAWAAFSNQVVLSVAALGAFASAVGETGVIDDVFGCIMGEPKGLRVAMLRLLCPAIIMNLGTSNTAVMSCLLPVCEMWAKRIGFHKAFFLMPLSYILLISGTFATFTTSTNLVAQGLLIAHGEEPFETFAMALPATICTVVAVLYLLVAAPMILSRFADITEEDIEKTTGSNDEEKKEQLVRRFDARAQIVGKVYDDVTLAESGILDMLPGGLTDIKRLERYGSNSDDFKGDTKLQMNDILWLRTSRRGLEAVFGASALQFMAYDMGYDNPMHKQLFEVLVGESQMVGQKIKEKARYLPNMAHIPVVGYRSIDTSRNYPHGKKAASTPGQAMRKSINLSFMKGGGGDVAPAEDIEKVSGSLQQPFLRQTSPSAGPAGMVRELSDSSTSGAGGSKRPTLYQKWVGGSVAAIRNTDKTGYIPSSSNTEIREGDSLILLATPQFYAQWKDGRDFAMVRAITAAPDTQGSEKEMPEWHPIAAGVVMLGFIALVATSTVPLLESVFLALFTLLLLQITTLDATCRAVKLRTVFTIVGAFGLGKAIGKWDVAEVLANLLISALKPFGQRGMLMAIFGSTVALGIIFHGTAVVVLMYPICSQVAKGMGISLHEVMAVMCISVSCQFLTPISYQTNLMAYHAGGYSFEDFMKVG